MLLPRESLATEGSTSEVTELSGGRALGEGSPESLKMNFDQKAVKFLANFYINGGKHWTHGPLRQQPLEPGQPSAVVLLSGSEPGTYWEMWSSKTKEVPAVLRIHRGTTQDFSPTYTQTLRELLLKRRPPIVTDLDVPGPAKYEVPSASVRESSPHPRYSIGHKHQGRGVCPVPESPPRPGNGGLCLCPEAPSRRPQPLPEDPCAPPSPTRRSAHCRGRRPPRVADPLAPERKPLHAEGRLQPGAKVAFAGRPRACQPVGLPCLQLRGPQAPLPDGGGPGAPQAAWDRSAAPPSPVPDPGFPAGAWREAPRPQYLRYPPGVQYAERPLACLLHEPLPCVRLLGPLLSDPGPGPGRLPGGGLLQLMLPLLAGSGHPGRAQAQAARHRPLLHALEPTGHSLPGRLSSGLLWGFPRPASATRLPWPGPLTLWAPLNHLPGQLMLLWAVDKESPAQSPHLPIPPLYRDLLVLLNSVVCPSLTQPVVLKMWLADGLSFQASLLGDLHSAVPLGCTLLGVGVGVAAWG
ncbi:protein STPG3 isoform X1 [Microcebus murinus]|uniref:protein STPG3 isoform X1 n=1 Tax=Microcebus murinus TaxID=30608 RepID=UPI003F6B8649